MGETKKEFNQSTSIVLNPLETENVVNYENGDVCSSVDNLCNGKFHKHLQDLYAPLVVRYVDLMESSIAQSIHRGFERESWEPVK